MSYYYPYSYLIKQAESYETLPINTTHCKFDSSKDGRDCFELHNHEALELNAVIRGKLCMTLDGKKYVLSGGEVLLANPYALHSGKWAEDCSEGDYMTLILHLPKLLTFSRSPLEKALGEHIQDLSLPVIFSPQHRSQIGYSMNVSLLRELQGAHPEYADALSDIIEFWKKESTFVKIRNSAPEEIRNYLFPDEYVGLDEEGYMRKTAPGRPCGAGFISGSFDTRVSGLMPDFCKLIRLGLPGLRAEISDAGQKKPDAEDFYIAADKAVDLLEACCLAYREQAISLGLSECANILSNITKHPPQTLREGIQLIIIYATVVHLENYGRLDTALGPLLADDISAGRLDEESATALICEFWKLFEKLGSVYECRILIGGAGREAEAAADKFALLAMEATRRRHAVVPVLTLRWTEKQNPALLEKALELISDGCIYPTLYNDDALIPGVMEGMHVPYERAVRYAPLDAERLCFVIQA